MKKLPSPTQTGRVFRREAGRIASDSASAQPAGPFQLLNVKHLPCRYTSVLPNFANVCGPRTKCFRNTGKEWKWRWE